MKQWWVSASEQCEGGWHWGQFFARPKSERRWGGAEWIRSTTSQARIKVMRDNDIVVAYQAGEGILGLALLGSDGYQDRTGGKYTLFDLRERPLVQLRVPVPLKAVQLLPHAKNSFEFV